MTTNDKPSQPVQLTAEEWEALYKSSKAYSRWATNGPEGIFIILDDVFRKIGKDGKRAARCGVKPTEVK